MDYSNEDKPWNWQGRHYLKPVKACGDLAYHASFSENMNEEVEVCRETSSQLNRRRMLQLNTEAFDPSTSREELSSEFLESNTTFLLQSPEGWISECFHDSATLFDHDDMQFSRASDFHIDLGVASCFLSGFYCHFRGLRRAIQGKALTYGVLLSWLLRWRTNLQLSPSCEPKAELVDLFASNDSSTPIASIEPC